MNRLLILGAFVASAFLSLGLTTVMSDDNVTVNVHQFGAVSYLADSGFYGVGDAPAFTNPMPMPDDPATYLNDPSFNIAMLKCDSFSLNPGGEGGDGPDQDPPTPTPAPAPQPDPPDGGGDGGGSEGFCL